MTWISATPQILVAACVLLLPGGLLGWLGLRMRGLAALAAAPVLSVSLIALAAIAADFIGVEWSLIPVLVLTAAAVAVIWGLRAALARRLPVPAATVYPSGRGAVLIAEAAAVVTAAFLIGRRLLYAFGQPEAFSQTFDNIFHLNAIRYIIDTGSASSLSIGEMTGISFYPAGWHGVVSLVEQLTQSSIPVSVNAVNLLIGALVWPLGCIWLVRQITGPRVVPVLVAGVLAAGFGAFPLLLVNFGVLYPNFLGVSLIPSVLAILVGALGLAREPALTPLMSWILLVLALPGLALAHPSAALAVIAFSVPMIIAAIIRSVSRMAPERRLKRALAYVIGFAVYAVLICLIWVAVRPAEDTLIWLPYQTQGQAVGEVLASSPIKTPAAWAIMLLTLAGIGAVLYRRSWLWVLGIYLMGGFLFVTASGSPDGDFRDLVTGGWYTDNYRLAALLPVATLPLAALGGTAVLLWLNTRVRVPVLARISADGTHRRAASAAGIAGLVIAMGVLVFTTQKDNVRAATDWAAGAYAMAEDAPLVSSDEYELMERLDRTVDDKDAVLVGNPWTGSSLVYALTGYEPLQLHTIAALTPEDEEIYANLRDAQTDPEVCAAVQETGAKYVLDFGDLEVHGGDHPYPGLEDLDSSGAVTLVDSQGDAKLYRITACG